VSTVEKPVRRVWWQAAAALALLGAGEAVAQAVRGVRFTDHTDYAGLAAAARLLNTGSRCVYCLPAEAHAQTQLLGHPPDIGVMPFANPPLAAWLLRPIAALPLHTGAAVFLALSLAALVVSTALLSRLLPSIPPGRRLLLAAAAATLAPGLSALTYVQWSPLLLVAAAGAVVLAARGGGLASGALLSVLLIKPQVVWLVVPALLIAGRWRTLAAMVPGTLVWAVTTLAMVGTGGLVDWYRSNVLLDVGDSVKTAGVPGLLAQVTGHPAVSFPAAVLCALGAVALLWTLRERLRLDPALAVATGLALSQLAAPHVFGADLLLLAPLVVLVARRRPEVAIASMVGLVLVALAGADVPGAGIHALGLGVILAVLAAALRLPAAPPVLCTAPRTLVGSA
jgi:hypothetical protein